MGRSGKGRLQQGGQILYIPPVKRNEQMKCIRPVVDKQLSRDFSRFHVAPVCLACHNKPACHVPLDPTCPWCTPVSDSTNGRTKANKVLFLDICTQIVVLKYEYYSWTCRGSKWFTFSNRCRCIVARQGSKSFFRPVGKPRVNRWKTAGFDLPSV